MRKVITVSLIVFISFEILIKLIFSNGLSPKIYGNIYSDVSEETVENYLQLISMKHGIDVSLSRAEPEKRTYSQ